MADIWLDSTICRRPVPLARLCNAAAQSGHEVRVHPQIILEQARGMAVYCIENERQFSVEKFRSFAQQVGMSLEAFCLDEATAIKWGQRLAELFPDSDRWRDAKWRAVGVEPRSRHASMTTDWWVALAADDDPNAVVVTNDLGPEWEALRAQGRCWTHEDAERELGFSLEG